MLFCAYPGMNIGVVEVSFKIEKRRERCPVLGFR
jgi:hypothetical protein